MTRGQIGAVHGSYWAFYGAAVTLLLLMVGAQAGSPVSQWLVIPPILAVAIGPGLVAFYLAYGPLFRRYLEPRRFAQLLGAGLLVSATAALCGIALAVVAFGARQPALSDFGEFVSLTLTLGAVAAVHAIGGLVVRGFVGWFSGTRVSVATAPVSEAPVERLTTARPFFFVKTEQRLERVRFDDIVLIEGQRDYCRIHTGTRRIMTLQTFGDLERQMPADLVCRVHRSYMVALDKIDAVERAEISIQGHTVPLSSTYRQQFLDAIGATPRS